jgi:hypothetical protein
MSRRLLLSSLCIAGCATAGHHTAEDVDARVQPGHTDAAEVDAAPDEPDAAEGHPDAKPGTPDATIYDAMPPSGVGSHLLLSEIELAPTGGEFVEIVNPTAAAIALDNYYLSDNGTYWKLPAGAQVVDAGDFIAKFPAGASIPSHGVITVAIDTAANFKAANLVDPTYSVASATMTVVEANGTAGLTNTGEVVVLFSWDGAADLVTDVDVMIAGKAAAGNGLVTKSTITIDGPDTNTTSSSYKADANTIGNQATSPASGKTTKRIALETGHETQAGSGNGATGDDETSEATTATWDTAYTTPTPGSVPAALLP